MEKSLIVQGRQISPAEVEEVRGLLADHPDRSRYWLSRELCQVWNWRNLWQALQRDFSGARFIPSELPAGP